MIKKIAICALLFAGTPALAVNMIPTEADFAAAVGQPVYDVRDAQFGIIKGLTHETGVPAVIVSMKIAGTDDHRILLAEQNMQPRAGGGWLVELTRGSIFRLRTYTPGKMPPGQP